MILEEFDANQQAVLNPSDSMGERMPDFPKTFVSCFARETFSRLLNSYPHRELFSLSLACIEIPIYELDIQGIKIGFFNAFVGAAGCVAVLEDLIYMGMENLVLFGTCGVLEEIEETSLIIPTAALRDEGTSYHYQPASREIPVNQDHLSALESFLDQGQISYTLGKAWTTDGIYRETANKITKRRQEGAICVDMECSAVAALAAFRQIQHVHCFYSADSLANESWDPRTLSNHDDLEKKDKIGHLMIEFALTHFEGKKF
ncbi:nucleoside phosphorylase [Streptococcus sp. sy004]|uniref:nucleoside phosphorylase n=1 Tax=Streptococcus sp. sy004 TaxID=2600149 RepID=UPI0011B43891|nr:nucleoside phosphorylase [Streptococcus sp. sy004]TWT12207.1 nucleoside phosphorylase [Streptococcus sp. sy004]